LRIGLIKYHACVRGACVRGAARENRQKQLSERLARDQCTYTERLLIIFKILFLFLYRSSLSKYRSFRTRLLLTSSCIHQGKYIAINHCSGGSRQHHQMRPLQLTESNSIHNVHNTPGVGGTRAARTSMCNVL